MRACLRRFVRSWRARLSRPDFCSAHRPAAAIQRRAHGSTAAQPAPAEVPVRAPVGEARGAPVRIPVALRELPGAVRVARAAARRTAEAPPVLAEAAALARPYR